MQIYYSTVGSTALTVYIPIIMWTLKISILFLWIETSGQEKRWYWDYYGVYLKHPRSPTTGNWLGYTIFNTIYQCLLYLKVWSDSSGVDYLGMTTCSTWGKLVSTHWAWTSWPFPIPCNQIDFFRATLVRWADSYHKYIF